MSNVNGHVHVAKFLHMEKCIQRITSDLQKVQLIAGDHGSAIRELNKNSSSYVSHGELLAVVSSRRPVTTSSMRQPDDSDSGSPAVSEILKKQDEMAKQMKEMSA